MVTAARTKPKPPMGFAPRAQDTVSNGKPRTAYINPVACRHYQALPAATTKPNTPEILDSIEHTIDSRVVTVASGGGAKHRSMEPHTEWHNVADRTCHEPDDRVAEPAVLTPTRP